MTFFQEVEKVLYEIVIKAMQAFILRMIGGMVSWFIRGFFRALAAFSGRGRAGIVSIKGARELITRLTVVVLAFMLVMPTVLHAGTVASTYDVTFGGFVKYDVGWSSQNQPSDSPGGEGRSSTIQNQ